MHGILLLYRAPLYLFLFLAPFLPPFSLSFSFHSFLKLHDFPDLRWLWHGAEAARWIKGQLLPELNHV